MYPEKEVAALGNFPEPRPFRLRPLREAVTAGLVRLLMTRFVERWQCGVRSACQQAPVAEKRLGVVDRLERALGRQPALVRAPLLQLFETLHAAILARGCRRPQSSRSATSWCPVTSRTPTAPG